VSEKRQGDDATGRDHDATRRDVDAGIRDRLADDEMPDGERDARRDAAQDRMASMRDRQAAASDREQERRRGEDAEPPDARD
jgi:hypothetical protein